MDKILEEELVIPDEVYEYARRGEMYADLIDELKIRIGVDEGFIDEETKKLLREARDEITRLRTMVQQ